MVGREVLLRVDKPPAQPAEPLLQVEGLHVLDDRGLEKVRGVSFSSAPVRSSDRRRRRQRTDRADRRDHRLRKLDHGTIKIAGRELHHAHARDVLDAGLGHIPEDRQRRGLVLEFTIAENIALHDYSSRLPPGSAGCSRNSSSSARGS